MNSWVIYLLPLGGALIGCCIAYACRFWLLKGIKKTCNVDTWGRMLCLADLKLSINEQWRALNLEKDIEMLVNKQLDGLFATFKVQVPMVGMFLSTEREEKLKDQARTELMKLVPSLKQRLMERFVDEGALQEAMIGTIAARVQQEFGSIVVQMWKSVRCAFFAKAFLLGFCLGLIEAGLLGFLVHTL